MIKPDSSYIWLKRLLFTLLRYRKKVYSFTGRQEKSGIELKVGLVGDATRGEDFIARLYGYMPEGESLGQCAFMNKPPDFNSRFGHHDILMLETNRLFSNDYRRRGYFTIPQWVEFGRPVVQDADQRYRGASKSLKSDLNRIRRSDLTPSFRHTIEDFDFFYEKMYRPFVVNRFGASVILKSKHVLRKIFRSGFLLMLCEQSMPVAAALVHDTGKTASEAAIGVLEGQDKWMRKGVSGQLDFHLHAWAAEEEKDFINVGHTRPFPSDGVYFNKRKWMMRISPDQDGVMDMAIKSCLNGQGTLKVFQNYPFIYQSGNRLRLFCVFARQRAMAPEGFTDLWKRYWTDGLDRIVLFNPSGFKNKVRQSVEAKHPGVFMYCSDLQRSDFATDSFANAQRPRDLKLNQV